MKNRLRSSLTLLLPIALFGAFQLLGCGGGGDDTDGPDPKGDTPTPVEEQTKVPDPPFRGWGPAETATGTPGEGSAVAGPAAVLVITGEQLGYIEPCGCDPRSIAGGISRRHRLLKQIEERGWPVGVVDLGSTIRRARRQSEIKFETILAAYKDMGYSAIGLGTRELNLGPDYLLAIGAAGPESETFVPFVSSNVTFFDIPDLPGGPVPFTTTKIGERTFAITSIVEDDPAHPELRSNPNITVADVEASLKAVLPKIEEAKPEHSVLLANVNEDRARELAEQFPAFDIVVCKGPEEPASEPVFVGDAMVLNIGQKGKYVGVVGVFPEGETDLKYELVHLDRFRFDETETMHEYMRTYQERLFDERVAALGEPARHPGEAMFTGAKKCGECHTRAYAKWKDSRHAHAFESLAKGHDPEHGGYPRTELDWIDRSYDPECITCHVTGWDPQNVLRYEGGFVNADFAETDDERKLETLLGGNQCENCHGPGSTHVAVEESLRKDPASVDQDKVVAARAAMRLMVIKDPETGRPDRAVRSENEQRAFCYKCHDADNSPKFEFADYWEKIKHPWRD